MPQGTQNKIVNIGIEVFGEANVRSKEERLLRFFEEAVELVRACGMSKLAVLQIVDYEFGREKGPNIHQEIGGVGVTAYGLADVFGVDFDEAVNTEIERVLAKKDLCRRKHAAKPAAVRAQDVV